MHPAFALALALTLTKPLAHDAAASLSALRSIVVDEEMPDTNVPPVVAQLMKNAKHDLRDLAGAALNAQSGDATAVMIAALDEQGVAIEKGCDCMGDYGRLLSLDITSPPGHSDLIAVRIDLSIPCGSDSALYLFRHDASWHLIYQREENDYEHVGSALGLSEWRISPPDATGAFLVMTTGISPACASNWQWLTWTVDRITPWCENAQPIDRGESSIYLGNDVLDIDVTADSYSLHFEGYSLDTGVLVRPHRIAYRIEGDRKVRIDPIANSPRDFVDEWLKMPDDEAARRSDAAQDDFAEMRVKPDEKTYRSFGPIRQCVDGLWQVRVDDQDEDDLKSDDYIPTYFIVSANQNIFRLVDIRDEARAGCPDEFEPTPDEASPSPSAEPRDQ